MNKKLLFILPLIGIASIPQLLYFWYKPEAECGLAVYLFGTIMTLVHLVLGYALWYQKGTRRTVPVIIVGSIVIFIMIIAGGGMLMGMASVRTAVFALSIVTIMYFVIVSMLIIMMESDTGSLECSGLDENDMLIQEYSCEHVENSNAVKDHIPTIDTTHYSKSINRNDRTSVAPPPLPRR